MPAPLLAAKRVWIDSGNKTKRTRVLGGERVLIVVLMNALSPDATFCCLPDSSAIIENGSGPT